MKKKAKELQAARTAASKKGGQKHMSGFGGFGGGGRDSSVPVVNDIPIMDPTPPKPTHPTR